MKKEKKDRGNGILLKTILGINLVLLTGMIWLFLESQTKIAYVQSGYLLSNYQGFKDASVAYQQKSTVWQANIDTLANELSFIKKQHRQNESGMSSREKELSMELINSKEQQLRQYQQGIQQKAAQEDQAMTTGVVQEVNTFLKEYGERNNYRIIFGAIEAGNIVYAEDALDLTEEVLDLLNKRYRGEI